MVIRSYRSSNRRYGVLRVIRMVLWVFGLVGIGFGILALIFALVLYVVSGLAPPGGSDLGIALIAGLYTLISGVMALVYADGILLMLHMEENTRATAQLLARLADKLDAPADEEGRGFPLR